MTCLAGCLGRGALKVGFFFCVNMYMFTAALVLFIYSVFVQVCFSSLLFTWRVSVFTHVCFKVNDPPPLLPPANLLFSRGKQQLCHVWWGLQMISVPTGWKKNKSVWKQINPLFFLIFSLHIFLLLVIYSNDRDIKQCFVGKSPLEFYGLWHIIKETSS